jgi:hypothetical protein
MHMLELLSEACVAAKLNASRARQAHVVLGTEVKVAFRYVVVLVAKVLISGLPWGVLATTCSSSTRASTKVCADFAVCVRSEVEGKLPCL